MARPARSSTTDHGERRHSGAPYAPDGGSEGSGAPDVMHFQQRARAYLRKTGRFNEDVLSEMVCEYLATGGPAGRNMDYLYLHALDRVDPRRMVQGERVRGREIPSATVAERTVARAASPLELRDLRGPFAHGTWRALLLLRVVYGFKLAEIGHLFGVTESRVSQVLGSGAVEQLVALLTVGVPEQSRVVFETPPLEVAWLTM